MCFEDWKNEAGTLVILVILASLISALLVGNARAATAGGSPEAVTHLEKINP